MSTPRVLISGAGIAGPALALWLSRSGVDVTVVEKAPEVRPGGQPVDFKGEVQRTVLRRMGVLDEVMALRTSPQDGTVVDAAGRVLAVVPSEFGAGEVEIARGDLARLIHDRTAATCEYLFSDSVTSLTETPGGVDVTFTRAAPRTVDLVVGADGIHSAVRRLAFGPEADFVAHRGYCYALADIDTGDRDEMYGEPGRMVMTGGPGAPAFFVFASEPLTVGRDDVAAQKALVADAYRGGGWRIPDLLARLPDAGGFYLDAISRVRADRLVHGRVVLLGDAAWGNALGGFGTGLAVVGAYVLAGELVRSPAPSDLAGALARYETTMRAHTKNATKVDAGRLLAPRTRLGMRLRNRMFSAAPLVAPLMRLVDHLASDIELPDYELPEPVSDSR